MDLIAKGATLPRPTADERHRAARDPGARLDALRKLRSFKIFDGDPGVTVFARTIDIETGRIEAQAEAMADGRDAEAKSLAMGQAYIRIGRTVGPVLADPVSR